MRPHTTHHPGRINKRYYTSHVYPRRGGLRTFGGRAGEKKRRFKPNHDPFKSPGIRMVHPRLITPRVGAQAGLFTIHGEPKKGDTGGEPHECLKRYVGRKGVGDHLYQIIIRAGYKERLLFDLSQFGVNWLSLFPNLLGLSKYVEWTAQNPNGPPA